MSLGKSIAVIENIEGIVNMMLFVDVPEMRLAHGLVSPTRFPASTVTRMLCARA